MKQRVEPAAQPPAKQVEAAAELAVEALAQRNGMLLALRTKRIWKPRTLSPLILRMKRQMKRLRPNLLVRDRHPLQEGRSSIVGASGFPQAM